MGGVGARLSSISLRKWLVAIVAVVAVVGGCNPARWK